jgi:aminoglycoside phosphotransferase (APT) family kinase protein
MEQKTVPAALRGAITAVFPEYASSELTLLATGWDCIAIDVDDRLIFKFPRHAAAERRLVYEAGILAVVRSAAVTMPLPDLTLHPGPPLFSSHVKLKGEHLVTAQYELLPAGARQRLAAELALFYAELHAIPAPEVAAAGAGPVKPWPPADEIVARAWPILPTALRPYAERTMADWRQLAPDAHGTTFGFFDGHGWNMAFDHTVQRLNGMYDFGDSGFGPLHREFVYSNWTAPDLTERIVTEYEAITGRGLDRQRIDLLSGVLRLTELAEFADDTDLAASMVDSVARWAERQGRGRRRRPLTPTK